MPAATTAYPATVAALREAASAAPLHAASFARPLARCDLAACRGTCCTAGVVLNAEEAAVVRSLLRKHDGWLRALLPALPEPALVSEPLDDGRRTTRSALVPRRYHGVVRDYPPHFADHACAFLTPDARCALQLLGEREGRHPWHYKPLACWLHPIAVSGDGIALPDAGTDRYRADGGFASETPCGRTCAGGRPADEVLAPELAFLGVRLGRDLLAELAAARDQRSVGGPATRASAGPTTASGADTSRGAEAGGITRSPQE